MKLASWRDIEKNFRVKLRGVERLIAQTFSNLETVSPSNFIYLFIYFLGTGLSVPEISSAVCVYG